MTDRRSVIQIDAATDPVLAGTKASMLARLRAAGERIPDGFVITTAATMTLDAPSLVAEVSRAIASMGGDALAVRSSAVAEDLEAESHAGEYVSVLGVSVETAAVLKAARRVVNSVDGSAVAVLVQDLVDATAAGAVFSVNPVTGDPEIVVSAVAGLADRLMEGSVQGDEWVVRDGEPVHLSGDAIDEALVVEVAALAGRLEAGAGHPVDIEWAHDGTDLYVLQCRPITALPVRPEVEIPEGSWQKDNTHFPNPVSPLMASYLDQDADVIARWMEISGMILESLNQVAVGGEVYVQPVPMGGGSGKPPPRLVMGILARVHPGLRGRMATAKNLIASGGLDDAAGRWREEWKPQMVGAVAGLRAIDLSALDNDALLSHIDDVLAFGARATAIHFDLFLPYVVAIHELVVGCERMLGWDENQAMRLLSGHSPASSEPTVAMRQVAETISRSPTAMAALEGSDGGLMDRVSAVDPSSAQAISRWVEIYGFRTTQYDWSSLTIAEQPSLVGRMIRAETERETPLLDDGEIEASARQLLAPNDVGEFNDLLVKARDVYPIREDNIHWTSLASGALLRRAYLEVGARLAADGSIAVADDIFMLERDEVATALGASDDSYHDLVRRRRAELAWAAAHPGPGFLGDPPGPPPDIGAFPEAGRRINGAMLWAVGAEFTPIVRSDPDGETLSGLPGAAGTHTGPARIIRSEADFGRVQLGDVVICPITNPSWAVLFGIAGAFVCDAGGPLSHTAVLTREYNIPSVLATGDATQRIAEGAVVTVDGTAGTIVPAKIA